MSTNEWLRLPGLYRRWEFEQVIEPGEDFYIEAAGTREDGTSLFAIYHRRHAEEEGPMMLYRVEVREVTYVLADDQLEASDAVAADRVDVTVLVCEATAEQARDDDWLDRVPRRGHAKLRQVLASEVATMEAKDEWEEL